MSSVLADSDTAVRSAPPSARRRLVIAGAATLAVALAVAGGLGAFTWNVESTDDAFVEGHLALVGTERAGRVVEVTVGEHAHVRAGDVLVRLDPAELEARLAKARADLDAARNREAAARASAASADAEGAVAGAELHRAQQDLDRARRLFAEGVASRQQLDEATTRRDAARAKVEALASRADAERASLGESALVRQAQAALQSAEIDLSHATIVAPFDGVVGRKSVELGAMVTPGMPLLALTADEPFWVIANFKETQLARLRPGAAAEIRVDALPGLVLRGHVDSIAPATGAKYALLPPDNATGNFTKVVQRVPVKILIDGTEGGDGSAQAGGDATDALRVGLSVQARVRLD